MFQVISNGTSPNHNNSQPVNECSLWEKNEVKERNPAENIRRKRKTTQD